jgi:hypothetical protein
MYMQFSQWYCEEGEAFLQQIFAGNGTRVHHCEPSHSYDSKEAKHVIAQDQEI